MKITFSRPTVSVGLFVASVAVLAIAASSAFAAGAGRKPSQAPTITPGVKYTGVLDNYEGNVNIRACSSCDNGWDVDLWRLPPLVSHDLVTVEWQITQDSPGEPARMVVAETVSDATWGEVFESDHFKSGEDDSGPSYVVSGSGAAQSLFTTQQTSPSSAYLEFSSYANRTKKTSGEGYETYPYSFTLTGVQHYIGINFAAPEQVATNASLSAGASLATGAPVPNGMTFNLTASWRDSKGVTQQQTYSAQSNGGSFGFPPLNLPSSAEGRKLSLAITRPADAEYQEARSEAGGISVTKAPAPPVGTATVARTAPVRHGAALLTLTCSGGPCKGAFKLRSRYAEYRVVRRGGIRRVSVHRRIAVVGKSAFSMPANESTTLSVPLSRKGRALLHRARRGRLPVKLAGHGIASGTVVLEGPARHHKHLSR